MNLVACVEMNSTQLLKFLRNIMLIRYVFLQVYLGGFDTEDQAALAYDLAAVKCRGQTAITNFPISEYKGELDNFESVQSCLMVNYKLGSTVTTSSSELWHEASRHSLIVSYLQVTKEELVQQLRRQGKGSNQNSSRYRGVTKHQKGKWEARIGQVVGRKYKYLGLYLTEKEAAIAYDRAAVAARGMSAQTNFEITNYVELLSAASTLLVQSCPAAVTVFLSVLCTFSLNTSVVDGLGTYRYTVAALHAFVQL